jgi:hypothetical protein
MRCASFYDLNLPVPRICYTKLPAKFFWRLLTQKLFISKTEPEHRDRFIVVYQSSTIYISKCTSNCKIIIPCPSLSNSLLLIIQLAEGRYTKWGASFRNSVFMVKINLGAPHTCVVLNSLHGQSSVRITVKNLVSTKSDSLLQWALCSLTYCYKCWIYLVCNFTYFKYLNRIINSYKNNLVFESCRTFFLICDILVSLCLFGTRFIYLFIYLFIVCNLLHKSLGRADWWQYNNRSEWQKVLFLQ